MHEVGEDPHSVGGQGARPYENDDDDDDDDDDHDDHDHDHDDDNDEIDGDGDFHTWPVLYHSGGEVHSGNRSPDGSS